MRAGDVMTRQVVSLGEDATAMQAATLMLKHRISGLPIVDSNGTVVGIVTEGDFLRRVELGTQQRRRRWLEFLIGPGRLAKEYVHACGRKVGDIMTPDPRTIAEATPVEEIVRLMEQHRIKRLPVVRAGRLVGIVSRANLVRAFARLSRETKITATNDAEIRERVITELGKHRWTSLGLFDVMVHDGIVELWGSVTDDCARQAMGVAAENVPGVNEVRNRLVWVEPASGMPALPEDTAPAQAS
jgi:CBS domain-containing protein